MGFSGGFLLFAFLFCSCYSLNNIVDIFFSLYFRVVSNFLGIFLHFIIVFPKGFKSHKFVCCDRDKGASVVATLGDNSEFAQVDIGDVKSLQAAMTGLLLLLTLNFVNQINQSQLYRQNFW